MKILVWCPYAYQWVGEVLDITTNEKHCPVCGLMGHKKDLDYKEW